MDYGYYVLAVSTNTKRLNIKACNFNLNVFIIIQSNKSKYYIKSK